MAIVLIADCGFVIRLVEIALVLGKLAGCVVYSKLGLYVRMCDRAIYYLNTSNLKVGIICRGGWVILASLGIKGFGWY